MTARSVGPRSTSRAGQALVELAVFGSIMLMMLGTLLNYGLRNEFQQSEQMDAFRGALAATVEQVGNKRMKNVMPTFQGSGSVTLIHDRHIPDPSDTFGVGSVSPVSGSANVVRDHSLHFTADIPADLPRVRYFIKDKEYNCADPDNNTGNYVDPDKDKNVTKPKGCSTAGFWDIPSPGPGILPVAGIIKDKDTNKCINDPDEVTELDKLEEIFGQASVQVLPQKDPGDGTDVWELPATCLPLAEDKVGFGRKRPTDPTPKTPEEERTDYMKKYRGYVRVIDPCQGDIISYEACRRIARQLSASSVTPSGENFCVAECKRGRVGGSTHEKECQEICSQTLPVPWYAQGVSGNSVPALDAMFANVKVMGIQQGTRRQTVTKNAMVKAGLVNKPDELLPGFKSESAVDVTNATARTMIYVAQKDNGASATKTSKQWKSQHELKQDKMFSWEDK